MSVAVGEPPPTQVHPEKASIIADSLDDDVFTKDFGFLPIPRRLQHNKDSSPPFGWALNILFAAASTFGMYLCSIVVLCNVSDDIKQ